ncbi:MAG: hemolysin III family protein [Oscillospiraceae bacterium]|nr:hemolysin III family protein [Oscillospiraceae bacterium]
MKSTKLQERAMPDYTRGEEIFNMVSHIIGAVFGIVFLVVCCCIAVVNGDVRGIVTSTVYGGSVILLYTMSSIYHGLLPSIGKKVMQVLDHCAVYVMIAGTYTPIAVCAVVKINPFIGWAGLVFCWVTVTFAIVMTAIDLQKYRRLSMACYIGISWSLIFIINIVIIALGPMGTVLFLGGGVLYSIGAVIYNFGRKKRYMHSVFHLFVLAASVCHFLCIALYVL